MVEHWRLPPLRRAWLARAKRSHGEVAGQSVVVLKPQTYMNRSGVALARSSLAHDFDHTVDLLVLVDDVALPLGSFRIRARGSAGGHNGLKSIEDVLRSNEYPRLRIGVGPATDDVWDLAEFVLARFTREEHDVLDAALPTMTDAVACWLTDGTEAAMNRFNRLGKPE